MNDVRSRTAARRLGRLLRDNAPLSEGRDSAADGLRLAAQMARRAQRPHRAPWNRFRLLGAGVAAAVLVVVVLWAWPADQPVRLSLPAGPVPNSAAPDRAAAPGPRTDTRPGHQRSARDPRRVLRFAGGGELRLAPDARAEVVRADAQERVVRLSAGTLHASIPPRSPWRWTVEAGAHRVVVTGTLFTVRVARDALVVTVQRGAVRVLGPGLPTKGQDLAAGTRLHLAQRSGRWVRDGAPAPGRTPQVAARPAPSRLATWRQLYDSGRHAALVADARRRGDPAHLSRLSATALWLLAQSARYAGAPRLALACLAQLRRGVARSHRAREASYLMARIRHDQLGDARAACTLYGRYLRESPQGVLRAEALGRRIAACRAAGQKTEARAAARRYLKQYPKGVFRGVARRALGLGAAP